MTAGLIQEDYSALEAATHEHYRERVSQGYKWRTNCSQATVPEVALNIAVGEGLETFIGDTAFDIDGNKINGILAIFTKERK